MPIHSFHSKAIRLTGYTDGPFTLEAFIIPDMGGVVLHKPNCYTLKVGDVRKGGGAVFDVHTLDPSGEVSSQRVISKATYPYGGATGSGTYASGEFMPDDYHLPSRELLYVNAQFTGKRMRITKTPFILILVRMGQAKTGMG